MFGVSSQDELSQGLPSGGSLEDAPAGVPGTYEQSTNLEGNREITILTILEMS